MKPGSAPNHHREGSSIMAKHYNIINAAWVVTGLMLVAIPAAHAQSKVTQLVTSDGKGDPRNCSYYLTNNAGWLGVDMSAPNGSKLASDVTFWGTLGANIYFNIYSGACGPAVGVPGQTIGDASVILPLTFQ
jgi:hypothetical protein